MFLELSFEYDRETKALVYLDPAEAGLKVLGLSSCEAYRLGYHRPDGGMMLEFFKYANPTVLNNTDGSVGDFCTLLRRAYSHVLNGGPITDWLREWLSEINPYIEDLSINEPLLRVGDAIRFYRDDGPRGSWVWKDTVREISVLLRPSPDRVEL